MSELPIGWIKVALEDLGHWGSGGTPRKSNSQYYFNGTIPWLVIGDLNDGVVTQAQTYITEEGLIRKQDWHDAIWFTRIRSLNCKT